MSNRLIWKIYRKNIFFKVKRWSEHFAVSPWCILFYKCDGKTDNRSELDRSSTDGVFLQTYQLFHSIPYFLSVQQLQRDEDIEELNISEPELFFYHHPHHVTPSAKIFLTLSHLTSLLYISPGRSSGLHCPAFARSCEGLHWRISLMSLSLLLQQCPACLVRLTLIVFEMGGKWPYSCCFVGFCLHDLFNILHHHHHVVPLARISLTLFRHFSLSFIASGRSSGILT